MKFSFEKGSISRVVVGLIAAGFFFISALLEPSNRKNTLFFAVLCLVLTWQQYSLYLLKKQGKYPPADHQD